jgi:hypothetical protein
VFVSVEHEFPSGTMLPALDWPTGRNVPNTATMVQFGFLTHEQLKRAASNLASSPFGTWIRERLLHYYGKRSRWRQLLLLTLSDNRLFIQVKSLLRRRFP